MVNRFLGSVKLDLEISSQDSCEDSLKTLRSLMQTHVTHSAEQLETLAKPTLRSNDFSFIFSRKVFRRIVSTTNHAFAT